MALWGNKDSKTANGTITIASNGNVSGTGTSFKTEAKVGNTITAGGVDYTIISITDATTAKVTMGRSNGGGTVTVISSATSYTLSEKPAFISRSESPSGTSFVAGDSNSVYGVDTTEINAGGDNAVNIALVQGGAGYVETPTVTIASQTALTIATTAVDTTADTITATAHKILTGTKLTYANGGGASITGLTTATAYYAITVDANTFKLATSLANTQVGAVPLVGAAVSGTAGQFTCTSGTLAVGDRITIAGNPTITGTATGITAGIYKVSAVTGTSPAVTAFTLTTDAGGALTTTAGTLLTLTYTSIISPIDLTGTGNALQTFTSDAATATATISSGAVNALTLTGVGAAYLTAPAVTVNEPRLTIPTSGITASTDTIAYTAHGQAAGAALVYKNGGGTAAAGLTDGTTYYVAIAGRTANAFEVKAANTTGAVVAPLISGTGGAGTFSCTSGTLAVGDRVTITGTNTGTGTITGYTAPGPATYKVSAVTGTSPAVTAFTLTTEAGVAIATSTTAAATFTGLTFTGETVIDITGTGNNAQYFSISAGTTATAKTTLGSGSTNGGRVTHAGWVRRTVGTGNRAGRIQYETLVAMGSISGDAADDLVFPDA